MSGIEIAFWLCLACVVCTYAGYPLLLGGWAKLRCRPVRSLGPVPRRLRSSFVPTTRRSALNGG